MRAVAWKERDVVVKCDRFGRSVQATRTKSIELYSDFVDIALLLGPCGLRHAFMRAPQTQLILHLC